MALVDNAWYVNGATGVAVTDLGTNNNSAGATLTLTSVTVPAGAFIFVVVNEAVATTSGTFSDGGTNSYTAAAQTTLSNNAGRVTVFYAYNATALSSATFTFTKAASGHATSISAFYATGIKTSADPRDTSFQNTSTGNTASPTVTSNAPTAADEFVVGVCAHSNAAARTYTQDSTHNFNTPITATNSQATAALGGGHLNINGSLAVTFAPTLSGAADTALLLLAFTPANSATGWWAVSKWAANTSYAAGALVRQNAIPAVNSERVFVCVVAGTSHATTEPTWVLTRGAKTTDNTVTWQECTGIAALNGDLTNTPNWTGIKNTAITLGQVIQRNSGASYQICTTAGTAGNGSEPSFSNTAGTTAADNTVTWTSLGVVGNFTGWQAPHARLANAFASTWGQVGNAFFIADNSAEVQSTAITLTSPGTLASPCNVYCVDHTLSVPPAVTTTGASIAMNTSGNFGGGGVAVFVGLTINYGGSGSGTTNLRPNASGYFWKFINGAINSQTTGANSGILMVGASGTLWLYNTTVSFGASSGTFITLANGEFIWESTLSAVQGSAPTSLFGTSNSTNAVCRCKGVDFSALGSGKTLVVAPTALQKYSFVDCKLGASVTVAGTPTVAGACIDLIRGDSSATNYRHERYTYQGTQTVETTIVRTGGASDGTTSASWKVVTTANSKWIAPFESLPVTIWNDSTSAITTLTFYGTTTGGGVPNNDDIWAEVEYLGSSLTPLGSIIATTKASNLAAAAATNNSSDGSTWGGGGAGNGFKIVVPTFTPGQKGPINIVIKVAKASSTYYIDPRPSISGIPVAKSYIAAPGVYANELQPAGAMAYRNEMRGNLA